MKELSSNRLVGYSRAGDIFHYRWAAKRCLKLIYPNSPVRQINIEGSQEIEKAGEYVIDVAEYSLNDDGKTEIDYYQLKHTTVQKNKPFTLSDLKGTFKGFAARFLQHKRFNNSEISNISFTVITNRKISDSFKNSLSAIMKVERVGRVFERTIKKYTKLNTKDLVSFCNLVHLEDGEGNYNIQKQELRIELAQLIAGSIDNAQINNLIALVQDKVLPDSNGRINREEVLRCFNITSEKELYPAPAIWEELENIIVRKQHSMLKEMIINSFYPVIVHAHGGVGKSVFCRHLINSLPEGSFGIAYDCFGAGGYRSRSESRHLHKDALVQIVNELASKGLCNPLLPTGSPSEKDLMRRFLLQLETSIQSLKKVTHTANLFILIDAADNAEMAAEEFGQSCFAHELLREKVPDGCKLVLLCRTERINLLQPQSFIPQLELEPFSIEESLENVRKWFPDANINDGIEFHRLTFGNPRVQANAFEVKYESINLLLASLGPSGISVENQIELQLNSAISKIKDLLPTDYHHQVNSICMGLAILPPHIPIEVLSKVANVSFEHIKSFVSDMGRSLKLYDTSIQFRDEPTETWFRNTFLANKTNYVAYINELEPIAHQLSYVAEVLPQLYLQSEQYDKLINIALSDQYLPKNNPIDARNIRLYRIQFAFKAALKIGNYNHAVKLAMRAGEEVAGNQRQLGLFQSNIDLFTTLQSKEKVQEIAFKRLISGGWDGSENVYSASLLSGIPEYQGEARGYLRAAMNWLDICFEEQRNNENRNPIIEIQDGEILELAVAHLNIYEVQGCVRFLFSLKPKETIFRVVQDLIKRLIDHGRLLEVYEIVNNFISEPYYLVAAISELFNVGDYPEIHEIQPCLDILCSQKNRIAKPKNIFNDRITPAIISFLEVCLYRALPNKKILQVLNYYVPIKASRMVYIGHQSSERTLYLKSLAMRAILTGELELDIEAISPQEFKNRKKNNAHNNEFREFKEVVEGLFPWYLLRIRILYDKYIKLLDDIDSINESSNLARTYRFRSDDTLPSEIAQICASIMVLYNQSAQEEIGEFYTRFLQNDKSFKIQDKLNSLRNAHRLSHLLGIRQHLENSTFEQIKTYRNDGPEEIANLYIDLARAVLTTSKNDATFYFNEAINISSKFGDEIVQRWEAVVSLAKRSCEKKIVSDELAYRFIRCAELIGENVAEKHWRRNEAMRVCTKMAPGIGISALSRWRDRDIGSLEYQSETVFNELVRTGVVSPSEGWGFIHFMPNYQRKDYLLMCLETESSNIIQETILEDAVYLFQREVTSKDFWAELKVNISKFNINNESLNYITDFYTTNKKPNKEMKNSLFGSKSHEVASGINWDEIFEGLTLSTSQDFATLITRYKYKEQEGNLNNNIRSLLREVITRLNENYFGDFIEFILQSENIDCYDILDIFSTLPQVWTNKPSFKAQWPIIVFKIGERCAQNLAGENLFNYFVDKLKLEELLTESLISGIIHGLANVEDLSDANIFFAFVRLISSSLQISEAADLLDYSLSRFELHIEDNFGDGAWNDWLKVSEDINVNVAGFLWSALGSPRSEVRWKAAHCVKTLAQFNCVVVVEALVDWLSKDTVDAFGCNKFPFYNLHARQYALMAFARISINKPDLLNKNSNLFLDYALSNAHILIQKFAAEIVLKIENKFPRTYKKASLKAIKMLGKSNLPIQEEASHHSTDSYWHNEGIIDTNISYHFAWDFDRYWYAPLGDVFRVPGKQIEELAANIIVKEWNLSNNNGYRQDPRFALWESSYRNQETWHDHSSYPRTDDLNFYLSYHAMLVLASRLMEKMPIIKSRNWHDDPWKDWISRHLLTREDGFWLVDGRNPLPLNRPLWISEDKKDTWQSDISIDDFLNCLKDKANGEMWINVKGHWHEKHNERIETYFISTALVPLKTSEAILKELSARNPYDYKLPDFEEKEIETDLGILGWISEPSFSKGLDGFDPYANGIHWPHYSVGNTIIEPLGLIIDFDSNYLQKTGSDLEKVLTCNNWSSYKASREEEPDQTGMRLKAKLSFLKHLCKTFDCSLIFDVNINREIKFQYDNENREYAKPQHNLFLLSSDGNLRTKDSIYQLG